VVLVAGEGFHPLVLGGAGRGQDAAHDDVANLAFGVATDDVDGTVRAQSRQPWID
jgi:hypothetical protein